jgi:hypothetical protein
MASASGASIASGEAATSADIGNAPGLRARRNGSADRREARHEGLAFLHVLEFNGSARRLIVFRGFKAGTRERLNAEPVDARERQPRFDTSSTS